MSLTKKGNIMTEQEFKQALDNLVLGALGDGMDVGAVLGGLAVVQRFTQVVYDMAIVKQITTNAAQQAQQMQVQEVVEQQKATPAKKTTKAKPKAVK